MENKDKLCKLCGINKRGLPFVQICEDCKNKALAEKEARTMLKPTPEQIIERRRLRRREQKKRYKQRHRDKYLAEKKRWKEKYKQLHKVELNEKRKENISQYKERRLEARKTWKKTPQGRFSKKIGKFRRRKKESQVVHSYTKEQWEAKVLSVNGICPVCKQPFDSGLRMLTLDHTPPISKAPIGFVYTIDNVSPMCASCNSKKRDK